MNATTKQLPATMTVGKNASVKRLKVGSRAVVEKNPLPAQPAEIPGIVRCEKEIEELSKEEDWKPQNLKEMLAEGRKLRETLWESDEDFDAFWEGIDRRRREGR